MKQILEDNQHFIEGKKMNKFDVPIYKKNKYYQR